MTRATRAAGFVFTIAGALACAACTQRDAPTGAPFARSAAPVCLVVVDGLDARDVNDDMPELARTWREGRWCPGAHGRAAMPARTNVNHATLVTGVYPEVHGVTGNAFWARTSDPPRKLGAAVDFLTETLFTLAAAHVPPLRTAIAVGKPKLELMFATTTAGRATPDGIWSPKDAPSSARDNATSYAFDAATLAGARRLLEDEPAFVLVNLADVDRVSHGAGPHSAAAQAARRATDHELAAFVHDVLARPEWHDGTIVVTSDHGFDTTTHPALDVGAMLRDAGLADTLVAVPDGGVAHVYAHENPRAAATPLTAARRRAVAQEGIAEALYRAINREDEYYHHTLDHVHPDWHVTNVRSGDLLLIAAPGYTFAASDGDDARLLGNHGAPAETDVPVVALGGGVVAGDRCDDVHAADVGRTLLACLGLRDVARLDHGPIAAEGQGRVLRGLCSAAPVTPTATP